MTPEEYRYDTEVVRLFYDYASSVVWFPDPVPHIECRLSPELSADLDAWRHSFDVGLEQQEWRSPELAARAEREGRDLAQRLGDELGSTFEIDYHVFAQPRASRYRSPNSPTNAEAAAVFTKWADAARVEHDDLRRRAAERRPVGGSFGWYAEIPGVGRYTPPTPPVE